MILQHEYMGEGKVPQWRHETKNLNDLAARGGDEN